MNTGWLSAEQAGEYVHLSARTVKRAASAGDLTGSYLKGRWLFRSDDLDLWVKRYANRGTASRMVRRSP